MSERIENLRLEPADNGFKVCYTEICKKPGGGQYDNRNYEYKEMVFKDDEQEGAIGLFKDLKQKMRNQLAEEEAEEKPKETSVKKY